MNPPLRIALLTHSTNPRGGVVHALELADALQDCGHDVVVHAPDSTGRGLFREGRARHQLVPARAVCGSLRELVGTRIEDYVTYFRQSQEPGFDIYHAQDGISANALADLTEQGLIPGFVRTVHHLDDFTDPRLVQWQHRGVSAAMHLFCVSRMWQTVLARESGRLATPVGNGVDRKRFGPAAQTEDLVLRQRLGIGGAPVFLAVGGVEQRKNTLRVLQAFLQVRVTLPQAQLVVAGGASLLDHQDYRASFDAVLSQAGLRPGPGSPVLLTGPLPDAEMPALVRTAQALVFPSVKEGFGLVVLEAMASGVPTVVSRMEPFTEYLGDGDCLWVDPLDVGSIVRAMHRSCDPATAAGLRRAGLAERAFHLGRMRASAPAPLRGTSAAPSERYPCLRCILWCVGLTIR